MFRRKRKAEFATLLREQSEATQRLKTAVEGVREAVRAGQRAGQRAGDVLPDEVIRAHQGISRQTPNGCPLHHSCISACSCGERIDGCAAFVAHRASFA